MKLAFDSFQAIVNLKTVDFDTIDADTKAQVIEYATAVLTQLHTFDSIERVKNLSGAIGLIEGTMTRLLRAAKAEIPTYTAHPCQIDAFLKLDFLKPGAPAAPKAAKTPDLSKLKGLV